MAHFPTYMTADGPVNDASRRDGTYPTTETVAAPADDADAAAWEGVLNVPFAFGQVILIPAHMVMGEWPWETVRSRSATQAEESRVDATTSTPPTSAATSDPAVEVAAEMLDPGAAPSASDVDA